MIKKLKNILFLITLIFILILPGMALAQTSSGSGQSYTLMSRLNNIGNEAGFNTNSDEADLPLIVGIIISGLLSLLGIVFIILTIYAGYTWMMARGNEEKVNKSLATIRMAIIGLIIVLGAYAISYFVFTYLPFSGGTLQGATVM